MIQFLRIGNFMALSLLTGLHTDANDAFRSASFSRIGNFQASSDIDIPGLPALLGPDGRSVYANSNCVVIKIPANKRVVIRASADAAWYENALQVHDSNWIRQIEVGNYSRPPQLVKELSAQSMPHFFVISGWTKGRSPKASAVWQRAKFQLSEGPAGDVIVQFEDSLNPHNAFSDLQAIVSIRD